MKLARTLASIGLLSTLLSSPAMAQQSANTLRWASESSITAVDPYFNAFREAMTINGQLVWDTLVFRDEEKGSYVPLLAKSWKWVDDVTLEFVLRDDVKFHDGIAFSADDVVYTFNYIIDPKNKINVPSNSNWIKSAEKVSASVVRLHLKAPFPPAMEYLSSVLAILPKDFYGEGGMAGGNGRLVGTGPYKLTRFVPGTSIDVERWPGYFTNGPKGNPSIQKMQYRTIPDGASQIANLLSGNVDWIWRVPPDQAKRLASTRGVAVQPAATMRISYLALNTRDMGVANPLQNPKVREAIALAVDREKITKFVVGDGATVTKAACYASQFGCRQDLPQPRFDPAQAKKLLAEAGFPNGMTLELAAYRNRDWTDAVAANLNAVGIKTNVTFLQYAAANDRVVKNQTHIFFGDWGSYAINDTSAILNNFFNLSANDTAQDAELAGWLKSASATVDPAPRAALYSKALARIAERNYWVPLWAHPIVYAMSANLEMKSYPDENPRLFYARWKK